jgi:hypothetical protein
MKNGLFAGVPYTSFRDKSLVNGLLATAHEKGPLDSLAKRARICVQRSRQR